MFKCPFYTMQRLYHSSSQRPDVLYQLSEHSMPDSETIRRLPTHDTDKAFIPRPGRGISLSRILKCFYNESRESFRSRSANQYGLASFHIPHPTQMNSNGNKILLYKGREVINEDLQSRELGRRES